MLLEKFYTDEGAVVAFWEISESEDELRGLCCLNDADLALLQKSRAERRRKEILAVRALMASVDELKNFSIKHNDSGKPFVERGNISISHSKNIVAVIWHEHLPVGIDVETVGDRILQVTDRVFNEREMTYSAKCPEILTVFWNCKECVYKLLDEREVDFKNMIKVVQWSSLTLGEYHVVCDVRTPKTDCRYSLYGKNIKDNTVMWCVGE
ncbi:MAG: 4'-phosphopantetheinyl transferase superfamily protein [Bacteroidales bacterium]|nr:4'-phosphopantetheinyl transferase superfamily protein [Bacteroidales bacterium]